MSSETRQATHHQAFRLTPDQHRAVVAAAEARGLPVGTFARAAVLRAAGEPAPRARRDRGPDAVALARLAGEVGRAGGLLKVLTIQAREGRVDAAALADVRAALEGVRELVAAAVEPLGDGA